ncbi:hypothetical protein ABPG72_018956 [Tetrahymena utriculariae]
MFKKRAPKKEQIEIGLEKIEKEEQGKGSDDEEFNLRVIKKIKPNPRQEDDEEDSNKNRVQELVNAEIEDLKYKSNETMLGNKKDLATVYNEIDTDQAIDARAIALKRQEISQQIREGKLSSDVYRGKNYSTQYTQKSEEEIRKSKITGSMGPVRAPANVRMTCRFDYDPSLCKDYHDTGYCVFGDSCLYLHDRGDYKNGFEQEQEWAKEQKRKQQALLNGEEEDSEVEEVVQRLSEVQVPKKCQICDSKLKNPIKTLCSHFFCESCALQNYATSKTCYVCDRNTQGVFQDATYDIQKLIKEREEEKHRLKQEVTSRKALAMLDDTEDSDESNDAVVVQPKKRKSQQKNKKQAKEVEVERTYIDENGIEIIETVIQRVEENSDQGDESDNQNYEEENKDNNEEDSQQQEIYNDIDKQKNEVDVEAQLALNQINKMKKKKKFKPSASDWIMQ